jgi:hypothetical protein
MVAAALPASNVCMADGDTGGAIGFIGTSACPPKAAALRDEFIVAAADAVVVTSALKPQSVRFSADADVPWPFAGQTLELLLPVSLRPLELQPDERVLASSAAGALWSVRAARGHTTYRTALPSTAYPSLAEMMTGASADAVLHWVPLLHFLRRLGNGAHAWEDPPLRAGFIIDDPNLHWTRYGFADYRDIAHDAQRENYHVAFATIPLDAWFTHRGSARLFHEHRHRLSLLVHGNDHGKEELARVISRDAGMALLRQASARIDALEAAANISVCRVMVPPHGACSSLVLSLLPAHGFEAACVSAGSLRAHNPDQPWVDRIGLQPADWIDGCPVLPRWSFEAASSAALRLAAYLGKPLLLRGHHQDLKYGLDVFRQAARAINALGDVRWTNMSGLSRMSWRRRRSSNGLHVQPLSTHVEVPIEDGVQVLVQGAPGVWRHTPVNPRDGEPRKLVLQHVPVQQPQLAGGPTLAHRTHPRHVIRRLLTEARDRLLMS